MTDQPRLETATLGGGCFWCLEATFTRLRGVLGVASGYMGGHVDRPSYEQVCGGDTEHAEVVQVAFDPGQISYGQLLEVFFAMHDPTTPDRQGNDVGSQYRSVIFCHDPEQARTARDVVAWLEAEGLFDAPIVTRIEPASTFWPAEDYHQDYFARHPTQPYCLFVVAPKVAKLRARFSGLLKPGA